MIAADEPDKFSIPVTDEQLADFVTQDVLVDGVDAALAEFEDRNGSASATAIRRHFHTFYAVIM